MHHLNAYLYTLVTWPKPVTWTLGVSADLYDSTAAGLSRDQVDPKVGLLWTPRPGHDGPGGVLPDPEAAAGLEPDHRADAQVGFNQFFDDIDGTPTWRYGAGIDRIGSRAAVVGASSRCGS